MFEIVKAKKALSEGNTDKAKMYLNKIIEKSPTEEAYLLYTYQLIREGNAKDALLLFEEKILDFHRTQVEIIRSRMTDRNLKMMKSKISQSYINIHTNYALALWQSGNLEKAVWVTEELYSKYKTTLIYGNLSYYYILSGDFEKAQMYADEGYDFSPDDPTILDNLGYIACVKGEYEKSEEYYRKLMEKRPSFPDAYYNYAQVLIKLGKTDEAKAMLGKCLKCNFSALTLAKKDEVEKMYNTL